MRAHILNEAGRIVNTVLVDELADGMVDADALGGGPGDSIVDGVLVPAAPVVVVPEDVEMWQCRCILIQTGKIDAVMAAIAAITDPVRRASVAAEFEFRPRVRRDSALTEELRQAAGITPEEADAMFIAADALGR